MMGNISFTRPFDIAEPDLSMNLDFTKRYYAYLNWGIFKNGTDTNTTNHIIYGSIDEDDYQLFEILEPTKALKHEYITVLSLLSILAFNVL